MGRCIPALTPARAQLSVARDNTGLVLWHFISKLQQRKKKINGSTEGPAREHGETRGVGPVRSVDHLPLRNGAAGGRGPREGWGRRPLRRPLWLWECSDNMGVRGPRSPGAPSLIHIALEVSHRRGGEARWDWRPPLGGHTGSIHSCALVPYCGARAGRREGSCTTTPSRLCGAPRLMGNAVYLAGEGRQGSQAKAGGKQRLTGAASLPPEAHRNFFSRIMGAAKGHGK